MICLVSTASGGSFSESHSFVVFSRFPALLPLLPSDGRGDTKYHAEQLANYFQDIFHMVLNTRGPDKQRASLTKVAFFRPFQ